VVLVSSVICVLLSNVDLFSRDPNEFSCFLVLSLALLHIQKNGNDPKTRDIGSCIATS